MDMGLPSDPFAFLAEPLRPAQCAAVSPSGAPMIGSFWFLFDQGQFWFSSRRQTPLATAAAKGTEIAVIVDDYSPPGSIRQIRVRGPGRVESQDREKVQRIYERYLGGDLDQWPRAFVERLTDPSWVLWAVLPRTGRISISPNFETSEVTWRHLDDSPFADS